MLSKIAFSLIAFMALLNAGHSLNAAVRYHCDLDSVRVKELLASTKGENFGQRVVAAALALKGTPSGQAADNDLTGTIVIRLDTLNQKEFLNVALAAAKASYASNPGIHDFEKALEEVSRKKGIDNGFASQFLYGADWIVDNVYRGNIKEMTDYSDGSSFRTKTLDYVSRHKDEFPALTDSAVFEKVKIIEMGFRSHRIPHLKRQAIGSKVVKENLENGDIIMMLLSDSDFDIYDIGIVEIKDNQPYLIHISRQKGEVVEDEYPLERLFKIEGQFFYGFRWLRPQE